MLTVSQWLHTAQQTTFGALMQNSVDVFSSSCFTDTPAVSVFTTLCSCSALTAADLKACLGSEFDAGLLSHSSLESNVKY